MAEITRFVQEFPSLSGPYQTEPVPSFAWLEKGLHRFFAALLAQITGDSQATGQGHRGPHPLIPLACCLVVQLEVPRLFLTQVHHASMCAGVSCKLWRRRSLTTAACAPALSNQ